MLLRRSDDFETAAEVSGGVLHQDDVMFETDDMERYWNGSPRNEGLSHMNDLFVYMVEATGLCEDFKRLTGTIMLLR